jgi:hypothetical protein
MVNLTAYAHYELAEVAGLVREIMPHDAEIFGNQFPAYRADPMAETLRAVEALGFDSGYAQRYAEFQRDMAGAGGWSSSRATRACPSSTGRPREMWRRRPRQGIIRRPKTCDFRAYFQSDQATSKSELLA